ncbi:MAG: RNA polymerase sigma factor [bacterium]
MANNDIQERFLSGERAACRDVEAWARRVVCSRGYYVPADERDDVVQEALAAVWRALSASERPQVDNFPGFVRRIAHRRCIDWMRRLRPAAELTESVPDTRPNPYEAMILDDPAARVRWLLLNLDPRCRDLFRLHYLEDLKFREIAEQLGTEESTQRVHMLNCTRKARQILSRWETRKP